MSKRRIIGCAVSSAMINGLCACSKGEGKGKESG